jgi:hypothetical protein
MGARAVVTKVGRARVLYFQPSWLNGPGLIGPGFVGEAFERRSKQLVGLMRILGKLESAEACQVLGIELRDEEHRFRLIVTLSDERDTRFDQLAAELALLIDELEDA